MQLTFRFSGVKPSDLGDYDYERMLSNALDRFRHRLKQVSVYVEDVNGPRGGVDKQCRCVLHLRRMPPIVVQDKDESMTALMYRVANRAAFALSRKTDRQSKRGKQNRGGRTNPVTASGQGWDEEAVGDLPEESLAGLLGDEWSQDASR